MLDVVRTIDCNMVVAGLLRLVGVEMWFEMVGGWFVLAVGEIEDII